MATDYLINLKVVCKNRPQCYDQIPFFGNILTSDADLMQMVYEQDVDLGFNWQHLNPPVKHLKDIDGIPLKNASYKSAGNDFFIDGETGEQVPVNGKPSPVTTNRTPANRLMDNQQFNFDECLGFLDNSSPGFQSQMTPTQNSPAPWQQTRSFSDLSPNAQKTTEQQPVAQSLNSPVLNNRIINTRHPSQNPENRRINPQVTPYGSSTYEYGGSTNGNRSPYKPKMHQSTPQYSPVYSSTSSILSAVLSSDEGMPMDVSVASPVKQDQAFPLDQYHNYNYGGQHEQPASTAMGGRNPSLTSLPEPGQSFFDFASKQEPTDFLPDLVTVDNSISSYPKNTNSSCLNPNFPPYPPPPLRSSPTYSSVTYETSDRLLNTSLRKAGEQYESDSGISLDHSPKGYSYLSSCGHEDNYSTSIDYQSTNHMHGFHLQEIKPYSLNASNNSTESTKRQEKKKTEKNMLPRESRDEKKARELSLPFTLDEIILTPVEDYNEMLARTHLTSAQLALIKDIRRRGKNKVAAQNCRKRKIETITIMEEDVDMLRHRKQQLVDEQKDLENRQQNIKLQYNALYQMVFNSLRDESGRPYDPSRFRLEQVDGSVMVVPHTPSNKEFLSNSNLLTPSVDFSKIKIESF